MTYDRHSTRVACKSARDDASSPNSLVSKESVAAWAINPSTCRRKH
jgi:hypothetical protein